MIERSWTRAAARWRRLYAESIPKDEPVNWILDLLRPCRPDLEILKYLLL